MPNIWFDVTTIIHWRRPPVGVVRVEAECFKFFAAVGASNIKFCHFNQAAKMYHAISEDYVTSMLRTQQQPAQVAAPAAPPTSTRKAVDLAKKVLTQMPQPVRDPVFTFGRKGKPLLRNSLHQLRRARGFLAQAVKGEPAAPPPPPAVPPPAGFKQGDVLISVGLDWDQKDTEYLYRLKNELGLKVILFCYDLIPVLLPHLCVGEVAGKFARYFVNVAWCADEIFCISKSSERDLLALLRETGAPEPKTRVVTLGSNLPQFADEEPGELAKVLEQPFILFVSTIERRKNHEVIYRAIAQLVEQGRTDLPKVVFVGMVGWGVQDFLNDLQLDPRVKDRFVLLNHVSDAQLDMLYRNALFTVYPSLYEGWGLPLAESLTHGKFCIASNTSSLPEVAGQLVDYVDPWETRKWAERIAHYLDHPEALKEREAQIRAQYTPHSWRETGRALYHSAEALLRATAPVVAAPSARQ